LRLRRFQDQDRHLDLLRAGARAQEGDGHEHALLHCCTLTRAGAGAPGRPAAPGSRVACSRAVARSVIVAPSLAPPRALRAARRPRAPGSRAPAPSLVRSLLPPDELDPPVGARILRLLGVERTIGAERREVELRRP